MKFALIRSPRVGEMIQAQKHIECTFKVNEKPILISEIPTAENFHELEKLEVLERFRSSVYNN